MPMNGPDAAALAERHAAVERQVEAQRADDVDHVAVAERADGPPLGSWSARTTSGRDPHAHRGERAGRPGWAHRRVPSPPTFSSTSSVAHGIAFRRSFGMGRPETTECPYVPSLMRASAASMSLMVWRACAEQGEVPLALDDQAVALPGLVVELDVTRIEVLHQLSRLVLQALGLAEQVGPLLQQEGLLRLEEGGVEAARPLGPRLRGRRLGRRRLGGAGRLLGRRGRLASASRQPSPAGALAGAALLAAAFAAGLGPRPCSARPWPPSSSRATSPSWLGWSPSSGLLRGAGIWGTRDRTGDGPCRHHHVTRRRPPPPPRWPDRHPG